MDILISGVKSKFKVRDRDIRNLPKLNQKYKKKVMGISNFAKIFPPPLFIGSDACVDWTTLSIVYQTKALFYFKFITYL